GGGIVGTLLTRADLHAAGVPRHPVAVAAPQLVQRLAGGLADDVPQRDFNAPATVGVAESPRVLLEGEWIGANQAWLHPRLEGRYRRVARCAPADEAVVGGELDQGGVAPTPRATRSPGRPYR